MKCSACGYERKFFPKLEVLAEISYEFEKEFKNEADDCFGRIGETQRLYACPACGTLKVEVKEREQK